MSVKFHAMSVERQGEMKAWVTSLGLDPAVVADRFEVVDGEVHLRVYRLDADGRMFLDQPTGEIASDVQTYSTEGAPGWLRPVRTMAE